MINYREILRLSADKNYSVREILATAHCSYQSYSDTITAAKAKGISWPLDDDITNAELQAFLFPKKNSSLPYYAMPDFAKIHRDLAKPGVNLTLLHEEYMNRCYAEGRIVPRCRHNAMSCMWASSPPFPSRFSRKRIAGVLYGSYRTVQLVPGTRNLQ